jgi:hypothetical protein
VKQSFAIRRMTVLPHFHVSYNNSFTGSKEGTHTDVGVAVLQYIKKAHAKGMSIILQTM